MNFAKSVPFRKFSYNNEKYHFFRKSGIAAGILSDICVIHGPANAFRRRNSPYTREGRIILESARLEVLRVRPITRPRIKYVRLIFNAWLNVHFG